MTMMPYSIARIISFLIAVIILFPSCSRDNQEARYVAAIQQWHKQRIERLTAPDSWLSLAGLYWLHEGENSFGSDAKNDVVFPAGKAPAFMGHFILRQGQVSVRIADGVPVTVDSQLSSEQVLRSDADRQPSIMRFGSLSWFVIKRGQQMGIRLKDSENPNITGFKGIDMFPIHSGWRITARFEPYDSVKTLAVPTVLGTISEAPCTGALVFRIDGHEYRLDPIADKDARRYFIIFADETNGSETYGAGRFLYSDAADSTGKVVLDFNKAYNPPCAFSPYATCPLPPRQNILPIAITAGEKAYHGPGGH